VRMTSSSLHLADELKNGTATIKQESCSSSRLYHHSFPSPNDFGNGTPRTPESGFYDDFCFQGNGSATASVYPGLHSPGGQLLIPVPARLFQGPMDVFSIPQQHAVYAYHQAAMGRSPLTANAPTVPTHPSDQDELRSLSSGSSSGYGSTSAGELECASSTLTTAAPSFFAAAGEELLPSINDFHFANAFPGAAGTVWPVQTDAHRSCITADYWQQSMAAVGIPDAFSI